MNTDATPQSGARLRSRDVHRLRLSALLVRRKLTAPPREWSPHLSFLIDNNSGLSYLDDMIEVRTTDEFNEWLRDLRDIKGRARILVRIGRIESGNFGDAKPVGGGVSELRLQFGPGYRVYYTMQGETVTILLCGGDKSTQDRDIERAKKIAKEIE